MQPLDGHGKGVVDHEADVGLVDTHAERDRGHDNVEPFTVFPPVQHPVSFRRRELGVVGRGENS